MLPPLFARRVDDRNGVLQFKQRHLLTLIRIDICASGLTVCPCACAQVSDCDGVEGARRL